MGQQGILWDIPGKGLGQQGVLRGHPRGVLGTMGGTGGPRWRDWGWEWGTEGTSQGGAGDSSWYWGDIPRRKQGQQEGTSWGGVGDSRVSRKHIPQQDWGQCGDWRDNLREGAVTGRVVGRGHWGQRGAHGLCPREGLGTLGTGWGPVQPRSPQQCPQLSRVTYLCLHQGVPIEHQPRGPLLGGQ